MLWACGYEVGPLEFAAAARAVGISEVFEKDAGDFPRVAAPLTLREAMAVRTESPIPSGVPAKAGRDTDAGTPGPATASTRLQGSVLARHLQRIASELDERGTRLDRQYLHTDAALLRQAVALVAENDRLRDDAERWRALLSSQRIRILGSTTDLNHFGAEFWRKFPGEIMTEDARTLLTNYADAARGSACPTETPARCPTCGETYRDGFRYDDPADQGSVHCTDPFHDTEATT